MKKLIAILLALCTILSICMLASCNDASNAADDDDDDKKSSSSTKTEETLYDIYAAAAKKMDEAKTVKSVITQSEKKNTLGTVSTSSTEMNMTLDVNNTEKPMMYIDAKATTSGMTMDMDVYYDGEYMYVSMMGMGYKQKVSFDEAQDSSGSFDITKVPKELFDAAKSEKNEDGSRKITINITNDQFKTSYKEILLRHFADVISGEDLTNVSVKDAKIEIAIADGFITAYSINYKAEYTVGTDVISYEISESAVLSDYNKPVTITPMEGYKNFSEIDAK